MGRNNNTNISESCNFTSEEEYDEQPTDEELAFFAMMDIVAKSKNSKRLDIVKMAKESVKIDFAKRVN